MILDLAEIQLVIGLPVTAALFFTKLSQSVWQFHFAQDGKAGDTDQVKQPPADLKGKINKLADGY